LFTLGAQQDARKPGGISCLIYLNMTVTTKIKAVQYFGSNLQELRTDSYVLNFPKPSSMAWCEWARFRRSRAYVFTSLVLWLGDLWVQ